MEWIVFALIGVLVLGWAIALAIKDAEAQGYIKGHDDGYEAGHRDGNNEGYRRGYGEGRYDGYVAKCREGKSEG